MPVAERALAVAREKFGSDHPTVGRALSNLAGLQAAQGRYAEAEPWYKRSLAIYEAALSHCDMVGSDGLRHPLNDERRSGWGFA